jgi:hypothetical protein
MRFLAIIFSLRGWAEPGLFSATNNVCCRGLGVSAKTAFAVLMLVGWLAGCVTTSTNILTQQKRDALRIDAIELAFAPDATVIWWDALNDFPQSGAPDTREAKYAFLKLKAMPHLRAALDTEVRNAFRGTDPARLIVTIRELRMESTFSRLLGRGSHMLYADIRLIDGKTGQVLADLSRFSGYAPASGGLIGLAVDQMFPDPIDRVSTGFAINLRVWIKTGNAMML